MDLSGRGEEGKRGKRAGEDGSDVQPERAHNFTPVPTTDDSYLQSLTEAMEHGLVAQIRLWGGAASVMS